MKLSSIRVSKAHYLTEYVLRHTDKEKTHQICSTRPVPRDIQNISFLRLQSLH